MKDEGVTEVMGLGEKDCDEQCVRVEKTPADNNLVANARMEPYACG